VFRVACVLLISAVQVACADYSDCRQIPTEWATVGSERVFTASFVDNDYSWTDGIDSGARTYSSTQRFIDEAAHVGIVTATSTRFYTPGPVGWTDYEYAGNRRIAETKVDDDYGNRVTRTTQWTEYDALDRPTAGTYELDVEFFRPVEQCTGTVEKSYDDDTRTVTTSYTDTTEPACNNSRGSTRTTMRTYDKNMNRVSEFVEILATEPICP